MSDEPKLTGRERQAIARLQKAIDKMPKTLWLYNNGIMHVMKSPDDVEYGERLDLNKFCVATIDGIESEGGEP